MMTEEKEEKKEEVIIEVDRFNWKVPECCREGWDSCPHVVRKEKPKKTNIGL